MLETLPPDAWMIDLVALFLVVAVMLYAILGGADFGAGIWEMTHRRHGREHEDLVSSAMGPVWEANHIWLIVAVVVLFTAFPAAFRQIVISFHLPMSLLLVGIICRGCAFTFRHYDVRQTQRSRRAYTWFFQVASVLTPLTLGLIAGGLILGRATATPQSFLEGYVWPWLSPFGGGVALFLVVLFSYLAAVFLAGEAQSDDLRQLFGRRARWTALAAVLSGMLVFALGEGSGLSLLTRFLGRPSSLGCLVAATVLFWPLDACLRRRHALTARLLVAAQVAFVLLGWCGLQYPVILPLSSGEAWTIYNSAAPEATLRQLCLALVVGSCLMFPALGYLLWVFKIRRVPSA